MRTFLCTAGEIWGGVEQCVLVLARGLRDSGRHVEVGVFHEGLLAQRLRAAGVPARLLRARGRYDIGAAVDLRRALVEERIDVLHTHGYRATIAGAMGSAGLPVRLVRTMHGLPERPASLAGLPRYWRLKLNAALESLASACAADGVAFVSAELHDAFARGRGTSRVVRNGIDAAAIAERSAWWPKRGLSRFRAGIAGRITAVKGHRFAAAALARLPLLPVDLHVFGSGPLEAELREQCRVLRIEDRVVFHGFEPRMGDRFASLDALLLPSIHEGLPYTMLEAMCAGVPVIASRTGGMTEVVERSGGGVLVPPGDEQALAAAIERLAVSPDLCAQLGARGRAYVRGAFLASHMVQAYVGLYEELRPVAS